MKQQPQQQQPPQQQQQPLLMLSSRSLLSPTIVPLLAIAAIVLLLVTGAGAEIFAYYQLPNPSRVWSSLSDVAFQGGDCYRASFGAIDHPTLSNDPPGVFAIRSNGNDMGVINIARCVSFADSDNPPSLIDKGTQLEEECKPCFSWDHDRYWEEESDEENKFFPLDTHQGVSSCCPYPPGFLCDPSTYCWDPDQIVGEGMKNGAVIKCPVPAGGLHGLYPLPKTLNTANFLLTPTATVPPTITCANIDLLLVFPIHLPGRTYLQLKRLTDGDMELCASDFFNNHQLERLMDADDVALCFTIIGRKAACPLPAGTPCTISTQFCQPVNGETDPTPCPTTLPH